MALFVTVLVAIGGLTASYLHMRENYDLCESLEPHVLQGPTGDHVLMDTKFCSGLAGDPGTIVVRFQRAGSQHSKIIFAYNPTSPEPKSPNPPWYPSVSWTGSHQILISISQISQVQRQRSGDGDMNFTYRIGKVDYPEH
jgi:hypothetical protein